MSGFAGFCDFTKRSLRHHLTAMTEILTQPGPDGEGYLYKRLNNLHLGLGHKRLATKDLSKRCRQPLTLDNDRYILIFDGRIFNAKELRKELSNSNIQFHSNTDAELVINSIARWGIQAIERFIGIFSFVIYSQPDEKLYLVRDRWGVKPLYYYVQNGLYLFASELKSFHQHFAFDKVIDQDSFATYFLTGYIPTPHCIFKHTYKVNPGQFIEIDLKHQNITQRSYWDITDYFNKPRLNLSENQALEELDRLLNLSIQSQMIADVPVGAYLSGGYDSSLVSALLQKHTNHKIKTFCIDFQHTTAEDAIRARKIAQYLDTDHIEYHCSGNDVLETLPKLPEAYDEPIATNAIVPAILINAIAKRSVDVLLAGDGEGIFAGPGAVVPKYDQFNIYYKLLCVPHRLRQFLIPLLQLGVFAMSFRDKNALKYRLRFSRDLFKAKSVIDLCNIGIINRPAYSVYKDFLTVDFAYKKSFYQDLMKLSNLDNKLNSLDKSMYLSVYAIKAMDRSFVRAQGAARYNAIELREPFSDHRILEFCAQLPAQLKARHGIRKYLLKEIAHKYIPKKIIAHPKIGFARAPLKYWLNNNLQDLVGYYLCKQRLKLSGLFNDQLVVHLKNECFQRGKVKTSTKYVDKLWRILLFQMWYEKWS
jgi:asparagine synthase (glutamine-hydrolysing)